MQETCIWYRSFVLNLALHFGPHSPSQFFGIPFLRHIICKKFSAKLCFIIWKKTCLFNKDRWKQVLQKEWEAVKCFREEKLVSWLCHALEIIALIFVNNTCNWRHKPCLQYISCCCECEWTVYGISKGNWEQLSFWHLWCLWSHEGAKNLNSMDCAGKDEWEMSTFDGAEGRLDQHLLSPTPSSRHLLVWRKPHWFQWKELFLKLCFSIEMFEKGSGIFSA